ncbi:beta-propeller domain-containing protein [Rheinheimera sp.]|uniref:beta-propeller domain-containing protein n=1 Tax=Rheinheimera sp. TaxID=1869214 RepID=UPI002736020B|nr:beta-propeller domain-containing protein [Rheinheimera sp.]MDP2716613.1 beta-propeller domain-containing protein [Rheinheimera sp.]
MRAVSLIAASVLLAACGGSSDNNESQLWQVSAASVSEATLTQVSGQQLERYLKYGLYARADMRHLDGAVPVPADPGSSGTNLVTQGVDEADRVKFANQTLYVSGIDADTDTPYVKRWQRHADGSLTALDAVTLAPQMRQVLGLYATDEQLTVLGDDRYDNVGIALSPPEWGAANGNISVQLFEQGNSVYQLQFDGDLINSRRTADAVWLVSRYQPEVAGYQSFAGSVAANESNMQVLENAELSDLLPKRRLNGSIPEPLIASQQCYLPSDVQSNEGSDRMVVLTRIATAAPYQTESSCILASVAGLYMSAEHLYLHGSVNYESHSRTVLHKFSLDDSAVGYQATGAVDGYIGGSQRAFMLYEQQQYLMLLTSDRADADLLHRFWVLEQDGTELKTVAQLPDAQQPDQVIGKPGEDIYAVRFAGDRVYVVTFERTDPLYTLDISDPLQPAIIGELEIPGYSAYLHSISDNLLWGLGQQIDTNEQGAPVWNSVGAKIALFDVSADDAVVQDELVFAEQYSPLEYQHHSLASVQLGDVTRLALPLSRYSAEHGEQVSLLTLEVTSNGTMQKTGELTPQYSGYFGSWGARSVLVNDDIYFVLGDSVYHSQWQQPEQVVAEYH